jgi:hypothetical protein
MVIRAVSAALTAGDASICAANLVKNVKCAAFGNILKRNAIIFTIVKIVADSHRTFLRGVLGFIIIITLFNPVEIL